MSFWATWIIAETAALVGIALYHYASPKPVPDATLVKSEDYLKINYRYNGNTYITYVPYDAMMAAQGYRVKYEDGTPINFHPGAIPSVPVSLFNAPRLYMHQGARPRYAVETRIMGTPEPQLSA